MSDANRDSWNKHKWKKEATWWDDLEVDKANIKQNYANVYDWLEEVAPDPFEHDYVLYTDGSGCTRGYGGYAAIYEKIDLREDERQVVDSKVLVSATYGSTVQRCEFTAFLDGVHAILRDRVGELKDQAAAGDDELKYKYGSEGILNQILGPDRISILWYTDRANIAGGFLFDENGDPFVERSTEKDLWMRWSFMAKHICLTPMHRGRNVVNGQAICDGLAGAARGAMLSLEDRLKTITEPIIPTESWQRKPTQSARF